MYSNGDGCTSEYKHIGRKAERIGRVVETVSDRTPNQLTGVVRGVCGEDSTNTVISALILSLSTTLNLGPYLVTLIKHQSILECSYTDT